MAGPLPRGPGGGRQHAPQAANGPRPARQPPRQPASHHSHRLPSPAAQEGKLGVSVEKVSVDTPELDPSLLFEQDPVQILDALLPLYLNSCLLRSLQVRAALRWAGLLLLPCARACAAARLPACLCRCGPRKAGRRAQRRRCLPPPPPPPQEALASELAARMNAMNNASDNAKELRKVRARPPAFVPACLPALARPAPSLPARPPCSPSLLTLHRPTPFAPLAARRS
jgi:hypothetical protein